MNPVEVYTEAGRKRVFAGAVEWPGWMRSGRDEGEALGNLAAYAPRYAIVAARARRRFRQHGNEFDVVERVAGSATTDFGAPGAIPERDRRPIDDPAAARLAALVGAAWEVFDDVVAAAPARLRKGPRGGGRDRDQIVAHVTEAERGYARYVGVRVPPRPDRPAVLEMRTAIVSALRARAGDNRWPVPYAARRIAWHVLDHAWEIEDKVP